MLNIHNKTHVIFDFDLTIGKVVIDWWGWQDAMARIIQKHNPDFKYKKGDRIDGLLNDKIRIHGDNLRQDFWKANSDYEQKHATGFEPNPEIVNFIKNSKLKMYIFSSNSKATLNKALTGFGILNKFIKIVSRDDVDYIKPDTDGFKYILDKSIPIEKYLFVGDSVSDEKAAKSIGMDFYKVTFFETHEVTMGRELLQDNK